MSWNVKCFSCRQPLPYMHRDFKCARCRSNTVREARGPAQNDALADTQLEATVRDAKHGANARAR